ncbi:Serine palmitoyltransferase 1 [Hondaea fermentalgiana]|uniref:serine C-palmitoyltransferase n=1 Tax=Hondaea fermentalgiana TaxID=2315210 RepID=A0A2R5GIH0_9STRA|nr:Serine palmitoyltransferase 1 [Hondaea fermentalgiana]|eukprot:GBG28453.1 Serine palmitoyltransferase 1 [Hondaea fermentalgiana]
MSAASAAEPGAEDLTLSIHVPHFVTSMLAQIPGANEYLKWWINLWRENPVHLLVETTLILLILYILLQRPSKKRSKMETLPAAVAQELLNEYEPEPLCPPLTEGARMVLEDSVLLETKPSKYTKVSGVDKEVLNLTTMDFLGFGQRKEIHKAAEDALNKYGCGSCGPRGFYGSIDVHVFLEKDLANFFGTDDCIVYSDADSTATSAIPAFSNRSDLLVVDEAVNDAIITGVNLSRSRVLFFKHNDMEDLARVLQKVEEEDRRLKRKPQRRFIVVEGLYRNYGDVCPLDEVVGLKNKYRWRLFLDESHSIGVFGASGKGVAEHFGIEMSEIDLFVSSLSTTFASVGGFCVGSREVVEHQRLSGAGYCFSASSPPFVSTVASQAIKLLTSEARSKLAPAVKKNAQTFHAAVRKLADGDLVTVSNPSSALAHVRLAPKYQLAEDPADYDEATRCAEEKTLRAITKKMREEGVLATVANYIILPDTVKQVVGSNKRPPLPPPSIRFAITALHDEDELTRAVQTLVKCTREALKDHPSEAPVTVSTPSITLRKRH